VIYLTAIAPGSERTASSDRIFTGWTGEVTGGSGHVLFLDAGLTFP